MHRMSEQYCTSWELLRRRSISPFLRTAGYGSGSMSCLLLKRPSIQLEFDEEVTGKLIKFVDAAEPRKGVVTLTSTARRFKSHEHAGATRKRATQVPMNRGVVIQEVEVLRNGDEVRRMYLNFSHLLMVLTLKSADDIEHPVDLELQSDCATVLGLMCLLYRREEEGKRVTLTTTSTHCRASNVGSDHR